MYSGNGLCEKMGVIDFNLYGLKTFVSPWKDLANAFWTHRFLTIGWKYRTSSLFC